MKRASARAVLAYVILWTITASAGMVNPVAAATESVRELVLQAKIEASQGRHTQAMEILNQAAVSAPNSEEILNEFARNSLAAGDPVLAMRSLKALTRMHPMVARYPYLLGVAEMQLGNLEFSAESLRNSLALDPQNPVALIALGMNFNAQKRFGEAKEALVTSLEIEPEGIEGLVALAEAEEGLGELESAEVHANRALTGNVSDVGAYFVLGKVRMSQGRFAEARDFLLKTVALNPEMPKGHYQLSLAYARLGDSESSQRHREIYQETRAREKESITDMRTRAGLGNSGMGD